MKYKTTGFTLLEVLVALAVVAIALAAVIKTSSENIENALYLRDKTLAHWVAMNLITEIQVKNEWPSLDQTKGTAMMADREWYWVLTVSKTADEELRRLEVQVYSSRQHKEPLRLLVGFIGKQAIMRTNHPREPVKFVDKP